MNSETQAARQYHNRTKHSYESVRRGAHVLDWDNQPRPFKIYPDLEPIPLPRDILRTGQPALAAVAEAGAQGEGPESLGLNELAHLLYFSAGITKRRQYPGGEILFRAAACTGALYEIELYLVTGSLRDLSAGVYHFGPGDFALRRLRDGDYRRAVAGAPPAPVLIISTGTYWRNAWKYQARTYRHFGWDNGTLLANLLAAAAAQGLPAKVLAGFVDAELNDLLGLDIRREVALSIVALGQSGSQPPAPPAPIPPLKLETVPVSREEVDYPEMRQIHDASSLCSLEEVLAWRQQEANPPPAAGSPVDEASLPRDSIEDVILRRGSTRRFRQDPITVNQLSTILDRSTRGINADWPALAEIYLIVHAVDGLPSGAYCYQAADRRLHPLQLGEFRRQTAYLALEQDLAGDAAVAVFFLADLSAALGRLGNRGYRAVQLEAGILGGKMYLAAYAQSLGATGLTFYDDDVIAFFSPHAAGKGAIFLIAAGHPARRMR